MPEPYWTSRDGRHCLYLGDCLEVLPGIADIEAVIADPPYGMGNDNDYSRFTAGPNGHGEASSRTYAPTTGDDKPFDPTPWLDFPAVVLFGANHFSVRLPVGTTLVWIKRLDGGFGSFLSDAELAWMKGGHGVYCRRDTSLYASPTSRQHPNEKPVSLMTWCMTRAKVGDDALVLDPYCGSGTTGVACIRTGRRFVGVEIEKRYADIAVRRMERELAQPHLPGLAPHEAGDVVRGLFDPRDKEPG